MRLYDMIRRGDCSWPTHTRRPQPDDYEQMQLILANATTTLPRAVPVVIDDVIPLVMPDDGLDRATEAVVDKRLPVRPPYDVCFVELDAGKDVILNRFAKVGVLFLTEPLDEARRQEAAREAWDSIPGIRDETWTLPRGGFEVLGTVYATFARHVGAFVRNSSRPLQALAHDALPVGSVGFLLDDEGRIVTGASNEPNTWVAAMRARMFGCWDGFPATRMVSTGHLDHVRDEVTRLGDEEVVRLIFPHLYGMALLHCKNVSLADDTTERVSRQLARFEDRKGLPPRAVYKVLHVKVPGVARQLRLSEAFTPSGHHVRFHAVRAHFVTYTAERPMLGKPWGVGTYLVPPHWRGSPDRGVVVKQYNVEQRPAATVAAGPIEG